MKVEITEVKAATGEIELWVAVALNEDEQQKYFYHALSTSLGEEIVYEHLFMFDGQSSSIQTNFNTVLSSGRYCFYSSESDKERVKAKILESLRAIKIKFDSLRLPSLPQTTRCQL